MKTLDRFAMNLATLGPIGRLPKAPGTWGSAFAAAIAPWFFLPFGCLARLAALILLFLAGVWAAHRTEAVSGVHDASCVIIDELVGQWIAMLPLAASASAWEILIALALFRLFDISKPWPVSTLDRNVPGGLGAMVDDVAAGALAAAALYVVLLF
jgi:phosphatidylglycerophosphatase A